MRIALTLVLAAFLAAAPSSGQNPPTGSSGVDSIEVIVKGTDGGPLDDVDVTLSGAGDASATTGKDGRVIFRNLGRGDYQVSAVRPGFMSVRSDGLGVMHADVTVAVAPAEQFLTSLAAVSTPVSRQVRFTLTQGSVVSGLLQDGAGRPLVGVKVYAARIQLRNGKRILTRVLNSFGLEDPLTNDLGEFRIFWLPPGEYFVVAEGAASEFEEKDYDPSIYFPGTTDFKFAGRILLDEGRESRAVFTIRPVVGVTLSGTITGADPDAIQRAGISISPVFPDLALLTHPVDNSSDDDSVGRFQIHGVPPGSYDLIALSREDHLMGRVRVEVGHKDLTGIAIELREGREIRGRFSISEDIRASSESRRFGIRAALESVELDERRSLQTSGENLQDLEFSVQAVTESRYRVATVGPLPPDGYVADIRVNGRTVYDEGVIEVGRDALEVEFDIRGNGGVIEGTVTLPFQAEVAAPIAIALIPDKPRRECVFLYKRTEVSSGLDTPLTFTFKGVAPGSYRILALDHLSRGDEMNRELIAKYEQRLVPVTVAAGARLGGIQAPLIRTRTGP